MNEVVCFLIRLNNCGQSFISCSTFFLKAMGFYSAIGSCITQFFTGLTAIWCKQLSLRPSEMCLFLSDLRASSNLTQILEALFTCYSVITLYKLSTLAWMNDVAIALLMSKFLFITSNIILFPFHCWSQNSNNKKGIWKKVLDKMPYMGLKLCLEKVCFLWQFL